MPASPQQAIRQRVGGFAGGGVIDDDGGQTAQILHQHHRQGGRQRPEFADLQRLHALIGVDEAGQHQWIEAAVGVGDIGPSQRQHARGALERAVGDLGQTAMKSGRQAGADRPHLFLHQIEIIHQPARRRGDRMALAHRRHGGDIGRPKHPLVIGNPRLQPAAIDARDARVHFAGQRLAVLFQPLDTEQFAVDRLAVEWI